MNQATQNVPPNAQPRSGPSKALIIAISALSLVLFVGLAYIGYRWASNDALATLLEFSGQPERDTAAQMEAWRGAAVGDEFDDGDGARTPAESVAHFRLINGAKLRLKPSSQIRFTRKGPKGQIGVDVSVGEADVQTGGEGGVTLESEFGEIVLDANSSVSLTRDGNKLGIEVELGRIQLGEERRSVSAGEAIELEIGGLILETPTEPTATAPSASAEPSAEPEQPELNVGNGVASTDLVVSAGDNFVVHDPNPPTAVGFRFGELCEGPARLTSGNQQTEAVGQANLRFARGRHDYQVRCLDQPDKVVASGQLSILQDAGTRKLPTFRPTASVATDGRLYTVMYQHRLPSVTVTWPTAPEAEMYTLTVGGRSIQTKSPRHTFSSLGRGKHRVVFSAATSPPRQSRATTIEVKYDTQAPTARVSAPLGFDPGENVTISGQALPGWDVSVGGQQVEVDKGQKFSVEVEGKGSIPIAFSHPSRGTHYYLRRPKPSP